MPRTPEDNEQIRAARREELLAAAAKVFARKGFAATRVSDLAQAAGLSHGLVYHYFPSKDAVYAAILEDAFERARADVAALSGGRTLERLSLALERALARIRERPEVMLLVAQAHLSEAVPSVCRARVREFAASTYRDLVLALRRAQDEGDVMDDAPAEELATSLMGLLRGLALLALVDAGGAGRHFPTAETLLSMLRPRPARAPSRAVRAPADVRARPPRKPHASRSSRG